ncbi:MAG: cytochrome c oxidase subunit 3 [Labilithrix sp.]|nr:cytochrome c oxidase subunit 3 [Labilithrix sp.]MCW5815680.1 cytochrome c oxidase subunit 3 [Labilithrix sp.]
MSAPETHLHDDAAHPARLGMWVFLASEVLFFAVLFTLYAGARVHHPAAFHTAIHEHADKLLGSINTAVLLASSTLVAVAVHAAREERRARAILLALASALLGAVFLALKGTEYLAHAREGLVPGSAPFWSLYYTMTGLHSLHVLAGVVALVLASRSERAHVLENVGLYWHFVDVVWIFLWPLFYLA